MRGGIVKSIAYIEENIIQGKGIIEAVSLEHEAVYPQIIIASSIFSDIRRLHFLTDKELEYGRSIQRKINERLELSLDEQKFMLDVQKRYKEEQLTLAWKNNILMRSNDEKSFLNYMYSINIVNYCFKQNIPFNTIQNLLQQFNIQILFEIPQEEYTENLIQAHKLVLIDKIKQYGNYTNINNINEWYEREKIIKKYIWLWLYRKQIKFN